MKWIKEHRMAFIVVVLLIVVIPLLINIGLYFNIPTHNTNDGDWLGFWGSFLGSIIGGIATLVGVIMTINQIESNEKILIVPLKEEFTINLSEICLNRYIYVIKRYYESSELQQIEESINSGDEKAEKMLEPYISIVNIGNKNAIDVIVKWYPYKLSNIKNIKEYSKEIHNQWDEILKNNIYKENIELLRSGDSNNEASIYLDKIIQECISIIIWNMKDSKEVEELAIGVIDIQTKDIASKIYVDKYEVILCEVFGAQKKSRKDIYFSIKFSRI